MHQSAVSYRLLLLLVIVGLASLYTTVHLPYIGEEGQYTISSMEMWFYRSFWEPMTWGIPYHRPPLMNWLIIPLANSLGWPHVLLAARLVTVSMSAATAIMLWWLTHRLSGEKHFALFCTLIFLSGDFLFRRSWIAYADPTFAFFVFASVAWLWIAIKEQQQRFLFIAAICLVASFLTKALTGYVFYAVAALVLAYRYQRLTWLLSPLSIVLHLVVLVFPFLWWHYIPHSNTISHGMLQDLLTPFLNFNLTKYLTKLVSEPFVLILRLAPVSILALYFAWRNRQQSPDPELQKMAAMAFLIILVNYLPYYFSVHAIATRYLMPFYPFAAIIMAATLWQAKDKAVQLTIIIAALFIGVKWLSAFTGLPWFERMSYRYETISEDIIKLSRGFPLYSIDDVSSGLTTVAIIDSKRWPLQPVTTPPHDWQNGFVISAGAQQIQGNIVKVYQPTARDHLYLLCRGKACQVSRDAIRNAAAPYSHDTSVQYTDQAPPEK